MTNDLEQDEAFVRAVADAPGDEAARRVYADWLEERGDARGEYLRVELKLAAREAENSHCRSAKKLVASLDPVWVARVSRPPFGVCVGGSRRFIPRKKRTTLKAIAELEGHFQVNFPAEYQAFLLNYNGGEFLDPLERQLAGTDKQEVMATFWGLNGSPSYNLRSLAKSLFTRGDGGNRKSGFFPVGVPDGFRNIYLLGVARGDNLGKVLVQGEPELAWGDWEVAHLVGKTLGQYFDKLTRRATWL